VRGTAVLGVSELGIARWKGRRRRKCFREFRGSDSRARLDSLGSVVLIPATMNALEHSIYIIHTLSYTYEHTSDPSPSRPTFQYSRKVDEERVLLVRQIQELLTYISPNSWRREGKWDSLPFDPIPS
jgi:hypothetical protein